MPLFSFFVVFFFCFLMMFPLSLYSSWPIGQDIWYRLVTTPYNKPSFGMRNKDLQTGMAAILHLDEGDTLYVFTWDRINIYGTSTEIYTTFSGVKLYDDDTTTAGPNDGLSNFKIYRTLSFYLIENYPVNLEREHFPITKNKILNHFL